MTRLSDKPFARSAITLVVWATSQISHIVDAAEAGVPAPRTTDYVLRTLRELTLEGYDYEILRAIAHIFTLPRDRSFDNEGAKRRASIALERTRDGALALINRHRRHPSIRHAG